MTAGGHFVAERVGKTNAVYVSREMSKVKYLKKKKNIGPKISTGKSFQFTDSRFNFSWTNHFFLF